MMMAKRPSSDGASWSASELKTLKKLASNGTAADAAKALGRTAAAVQQKAMRSGISFRKSRRAPAKKKKNRRVSEAPGRAYAGRGQETPKAATAASRPRGAV